MKKQADRSNINASKTPDSGGRSSKNGEIEAYLARRFKTTFLDLLCPPKLHGYSYTGKIYPQEKDTLTYIGQNLIINIDDQLKALIKRARAVSMDAVYAEAKSLLQSGYRYWFNDEEIVELYRESEAFQVQTAEMELLLRCFELPTTDSDCSYLNVSSM